MTLDTDTSSFVFGSLRNALLGGDGWMYIHVPVRAYLDVTLEGGGLHSTQTEIFKNVSDVFIQIDT